MFGFEVDDEGEDNDKDKDKDEDYWRKVAVTVWTNM